MLFRSDEAAAELRKVLELDPGFLLAHVYVIFTNVSQGRPEEALEAARKLMTVATASPIPTGMLAYALAVAGQPGEARKVLDQLLELHRQRYVPAPQFFFVYWGLNDTETALDWLEKACEERALNLPILIRDPLSEQFRSLPRFQDIRRRMGLS